MAITQEQIDAFEQQLVDRGGALQATFNDQTITFTSYEDALKFLAHLKRMAAGGSLTRYVATDRDL